MVYNQSSFSTTKSLSDNTFTKFNAFVKYQNFGIDYLEIVSNIIHRSVRNGILINIHLSPPNQRLKLTEIAVGDLSARISSLRSDVVRRARNGFQGDAARRRTLAAIR